MKTNNSVMSAESNEQKDFYLVTVTSPKEYLFNSVCYAENGRDTAVFDNPKEANAYAKKLSGEFPNSIYQVWKATPEPMPVEATETVLYKAVEAKLGVAVGLGKTNLRTAVEILDNLIFEIDNPKPHMDLDTKTNLLPNAFLFDFSNKGFAYWYNIRCCILEE